MKHINHGNALSSRASPSPNIKTVNTFRTNVIATIFSSLFPAFLSTKKEKEKRREETKRRAIGGLINCQKMHEVSPSLSLRDRFTPGRNRPRCNITETYVPLASEKKLREMLMAANYLHVLSPRARTESRRVGIRARTGRGDDLLES